MIEEIILSNDQRGVASKAATFLPCDFAQKAAKVLHDSVGTVAIATGFLVNGSPETDGPPGAIFLGRALNNIGFQVVYVAHPDCAMLLQKTLCFQAEVVPFPTGSVEAADTFSKQFLNDRKPKSVVSIECLGPNPLGQFLDMRGRDVSRDTSRIDRLFIQARSMETPTIGVGDGGNEIGFGAIDGTHDLGLNDGHCVTHVDLSLIHISEPTRPY